MEDLKKYLKMLFAIVTPSISVTESPGAFVTTIAFKNENNTFTLFKYFGNAST